MKLQQKLAVLADAAKYDASCASSGIKSRSAPAGGIGSAEGSGICHSYTPDGRCVSLLKILLTNHCIYDCSYCINRRSSSVPRARFSVAEVVDLTLGFYRRNYIEGLFLSSGIIRDADYTMGELVAVARTLRETHRFGGYIHLKTIPEASPELIDEAARWADRLSINVELPTQVDLDALAPEKRLVQICKAMGRIRTGIEDATDGAGVPSAPGVPGVPHSRGRAVTQPSRPAIASPYRGRPDRTGSGRRVFAPAGQSTQMIVGATPASDRVILERAASLYDAYRLRRVYYSGYSPIPDPASALPAEAPPLVREHRLYQADWLLRFYGFTVPELFENAPADLDLGIDPKLAWALRNRAEFPADVNRAPRELLLRVPGLGVRNVERILAVRRHRALRSEDLARLNVSRRALHFLTAADATAAGRTLDSLRLSHLVAPARQQLDLFAAVHARSGEF
jgi:putative DNA modification/repair radical SAM protein